MSTCRSSLCHAGAFVRLLILVTLLGGLSVGAGADQFAQWPELRKGHAPDTVFDIGNLDTVNLLSGNLTLSIPLGGSYPASTSLSYGLTLVYNSNPWEALESSRETCKIENQIGNTFDTVTFHPKTLDRLSNAGPGWMVTMGQFEPDEWEYFEHDKPPFTYVGIDGGRHGLHEELHHGGRTDSGIYYSKDGSFLRMDVDASCSASSSSNSPCRRLEFPDGSFHEFHDVSLDDEEDYRPTRIEDAFGNWLTIDYFAHRWTITDQHGRIQFVDFDTSTPARSYTRISEVSLSAFDGKRATYTFQYLQAQTIERHHYDITYHDDIRCIPDDEGGFPQVFGNTVAGVRFLDRIVQPDGSYFEMSYFDADGGLVSGGRASGFLNGLRLPSGLRYRWDYTTRYGRNNVNRRSPHPLERVTGVASKQRYLVNDGGSETDLVTWTYEPRNAYFRAPGDPAPPQPESNPCYQRTDVRFWTGDPEANGELVRWSRSYFSKAIGSNDGLRFRSRQSLPFTACVPDDDVSNPNERPGSRTYFDDPQSPGYYDGLFLSQEIFDPSTGEVVRSTWVDYETDAPLHFEEKDGDKRRVRQRTVFHDDGDRWTESRASDFDGLGQHRRRSELANFSQSSPSDSTSAQARATYTAYNMSAENGGPSTPRFTPPLSHPWLLGLYTEQCLHDGLGGAGCSGAHERTLYDFDPQTGFLNAMRQLRGTQPGTTDILTVYSDDGHAFGGVADDGQVDEEWLYGGDPEFEGETLLNPSAPFSPNGIEADRAVRHWYEFGVASRSVVYDGSTPFLEILDQRIDASTGLVQKSIEPTDLETLLDYDTSGRLLSIRTRKNGQFQNVADHLFKYTLATNGQATDLTVAGVDRFCSPTDASCTPTGRAPLGLAFEMRRCRINVQTYDACTGSNVVAQQEFFYDRQGRLIDHRRMMPRHVEGVEVRQEALRQIAFDLADRKTAETEWRLPADEFEVFATTYSGFDVFDRPATVRRPDGRPTNFSYGGERLTASTVGIWDGSAEKESTTEHARDGFGRLAQVTEPSGSGGAAVGTTYAYGPSDRLITVCVGDGDSNPSNACNGQRRTFDYDGAGLMTGENHPEIDDAILYTYDAQGNPLAKDFAGTAHDLLWTYDAAGRAIEVRDGDEQLFYELFYGRGGDASRKDGLLYQARRHNRVPASSGSSTLIDHVVTETFDHSLPGDRLASYTVRSSRGASFKTSYSYGPLGEVVGTDYPICDRAPCSDLGVGLALSRRHELGRLAEIPGWINAVDYHADGQLRRLDHANGVVDTMARNATTWKPLESITVENPSDTLWNSGAYSFDAEGNIVSIGIESFAYDLVGRLTQATVATAAIGPQTESLTYDLYGNVRTITRSTESGQRQLAPSTTTNRLGAAVAAYDLAGNITEWTESGRSFSLAYAPDNRVVSLDGNGQGRGYVYTASGERFGLLDFATGTAEYTPRDAANGLLARFERTSDGTWSRATEYVHAAGKVIGTTANGVVRHHHHDHLGSTRLLTDASGAQVGELTTYFPFGVYASNGAPNGPEHRFTGHERDEIGLASAALDYMHARHYASAVGRFASVDPVLGQPETPQSWNRYAYTKNRPTKYVDPDGRFGHIALGATIGAAAAGGLEIFSQVTSGQDEIDWQKVGASSLKGGLLGGTAAATGGASLVVEAGSIGLATVGGGLLERGLDGDSSTVAFDEGQIAADLVSGTLGGVASNRVYGAVRTRVAQSPQQRTMERIADSRVRAVKERPASRRAGAEAVQKEVLKRPGEKAKSVASKARSAVAAGVQKIISFFTGPEEKDEPGAR
ncbi:MAG: RHS repeat-associated core domain-containing protein [Acidobacteriota bacterium]